MENTYWSQNGKYQTDYDRLVGLMPAVGDAETVAGEMIRSVSRLGHELYNNGMGNNSSGAVNFLWARSAIDQKTHEAIHPMTMGRIYNGNYNGDSLQVAIESAIDQTIRYILDNPTVEIAPNKESMFDHSDEDEHYCEECDELADGSWGSHCQSCEDHIEEMNEDDDGA